MDFQIFQLCFVFLSPGFRIPQAKISQIPESVFPYIGRLVLISRASPLTVSLCFLFCFCLFVFCRALKQNKELKEKTEELEKRFITMVHLQLLHSKVCLASIFLATCVAPILCFKIVRNAFLPTIQGGTNFHVTDDWGGTTNHILNCLYSIVV